MANRIDPNQTVRPDLSVQSMAAFSAKQTNNRHI